MSERTLLDVAYRLKIGDYDGVDIMRAWTALHEIDRLQKIDKDRAKQRSADFARRVPVEQWLLDAASGKIPLPNKEECKKLAMQLGIPNEYWT